MPSPWRKRSPAKGLWQKSGEKSDRSVKKSDQKVTERVPKTKKVIELHLLTSFCGTLMTPSEKVTLSELFLLGGFLVFFCADFLFFRAFCPHPKDFRAAVGIENPFFPWCSSFPLGPCHIKNTTVILIHNGGGRKRSLKHLVFLGENSQEVSTDSGYLRKKPFAAPNRPKPPQTQIFPKTRPRPENPPEIAEFIVSAIQNPTDFH